MNTLVDIVIPFWKSYDYIYECLKCIPDAMGDISYKIILSDDGNETDEDRMELAETVHDMDGKIVRSSQNKGYPHAVNLGVQRSFSPLIFVLTADVECWEGSGEVLVSAMDDPDVALAGMKLIFPEGTPNGPAGKVQHVGLNTDIQGNPQHTFIGWSPDNPKVNNVREVMAVTGAAFMTRRKVWQKVSGFWEGYGRGTWEDVEYAMQVREMGYNVIVETDAIAYHHVGVTPRHHGVGFPIRQNQLKFMQRWGEKLKYWEWRVV